jgi:AraC family transcriptional regulator
MRAPPSASRPAAFRFTEMRHTASIPVHAHAAATITILLGGAYGESYPGPVRPGRMRELEFCSSSILFRPGGIEHVNRVGAIGAHSLVVEVGAERMEELREYTRVFDGITFRRGSALEAVARRMQREVSRPDAAALLALEGLTLELLALTARDVVGDDGARPRWLRRAREVLHDRFGEQSLRIADVAEAAGVHPVHLARAFRAHHGTTPADYLRALRLEWAARELATTARPIGDIALSAGFADQSHFTRAFRAGYGATPRQWRSRQR